MTIVDHSGTDHVELFTPGEHAIISSYLGLPPPVGLALPRLSAALRPFRLPELYDDITPVAAATAVIVLERIQARVPNWSWMSPKGIVYGREDRSTDVERSILMSPVPLFQINWAFTAPGLDWPVAYHCTYVPLYDRYVVTQSADSTDAYGVCDVALGSFSPAADFETACLDIIRVGWAVDASNEGQRFVELTANGRIRADAINALADETWPVWTEEEEEDLQDDAA